MPIGVLSSYDGLGCLRYLRIRTIFKMANIVTWQERGINLLATKYASKDILDVLTKVHFVQFATFQQPEHKCQILGREVTSCLKPIASSHSDMSKTSLSLQLSKSCDNRYESILRWFLLFLL